MWGLTDEKHHSQSSYSHSPVDAISPLCLAEAFSGPSNLQFLVETFDSLKFRWTAALGPVNGYVVQYVPLSGLGQPITSEFQQVGTVLM